MRKDSKGYRKRKRPDQKKSTEETGGNANKRGKMMKGWGNVDAWAKGVKKDADVAKEGECDEFSKALWRMGKKLEELKKDANQIANENIGHKWKKKFEDIPIYTIGSNFGERAFHKLAVKRYKRFKEICSTKFFGKPVTPPWTSKNPDDISYHIVRIVGDSNQVSLMFRESDNYFVAFTPEEPDESALWFTFNGLSIPHFCKQIPIEYSCSYIDISKVKVGFGCAPNIVLVLSQFTRDNALCISMQREIALQCAMLMFAEPMRSGDLQMVIKRFLRRQIADSIPQFISRITSWGKMSRYGMRHECGEVNALKEIDQLVPNLFNHEKGKYEIWNLIGRQKRDLDAFNRLGQGIGKGLLVTLFNHDYTIKYIMYQKNWLNEEGGNYPPHGIPSQIVEELSLNPALRLTLDIHDDGNTNTGLISMDCIDDVKTNLEGMSRIIFKSEEIAQVGIVSANGEREFGELTAKAMEKVGREGVITIADGELEIVHPNFITNQKNHTFELYDPLIFIHKTILNTHTVAKVVDLALKKQKPLLIIAEDVKTEVLATLISKKLHGGVKVCMVKSPIFGQSRKANLQGLAILTGGEIITEDLGMNFENFEPQMLGTCKKVTISKNVTVILDGAGRKKAIEEIADQLRSAIEQSTSDYYKQKLQERLTKLLGGVAVLEIGGASEAEIVEKDRVTDTAVWASIVPGCGAAFLYASKGLDKLKSANFDQKIVQTIQSALKTSVQNIASNADVEGDAIVGKLLGKENSDAAKG